MNRNKPLLVYKDMSVKINDLSSLRLTWVQAIRRQMVMMFELNQFFVDYVYTSRFYREEIYVNILRCQCFVTSLSLKHLPIFLVDPNPDG